MIYSYTFETTIGKLEIQEEWGKIVSLRPLQKGQPSPPHNSHKPSDLLYEAYTQLKEYFNGKRISFDLPTALSGTEFQLKVWSELQNIPYGKTASYKEIAINTGSPKAARAVGNANNKNPILIIVPCHRVIKSSGDIGDYAFGSSMKRYLLELEKENFGAGL